MSALTETHHHVARLLRWHGRLVAFDRKVPWEEVTVSGRVERYHRTDGYRQVTVVATNRKMLEELWRAVEDAVRAIGRNAAVVPEIGMAHPDGRTHVLDVSIWRDSKPEVSALRIS